jgi:hypothetical protein
VVRGGVGLFYAQDEGFGVSQRQHPALRRIRRLRRRQRPAQHLQHHTAQPNVACASHAADPKTYSFDPRATVQIRSWPLRYTIPYVEQWNLSMQKELARNFVWEILREQRLPVQRMGTR